MISKQWFAILLLISVTLLILAVITPRLIRFIIKKLFDSSLKIMLTDLYEENLLELYATIKRVGFRQMLELELRAESGEVIERPLGTIRKFPNFDGLMFDVAQLRVLPTEQSVQIDTKVVIGPNAAKPLVVDIPILIGGMGYGFGLSDKAKIALAKGTALAGTATNSGSGPFLKAERDNARHWILQYSRGSWAKSDDVLRQADAIELQFGQGSLGGLGFKIKAAKLDEQLQIAFSSPPGMDVELPARFPEMQKPEELPSLIQSIRSRVDGVPVGVKLACSKYLEIDLNLALEAGVDFITLSGAQAGTHGSPPSIGETHGLPTLLALVRAANFLEQNQAKGKVSLIVGGGITEPGEILKALALGADAVHIGTAAMLAISHNQIRKPLPFEPPTQLVWYGAKFAQNFDVNMGAQYLANFLKSTADEIAQGVRIMGKTATNQVTKQDLFALDRETADMVGVPIGWEPLYPEQQLQGLHIITPTRQKRIKKT